MAVNQKITTFINTFAERDAQRNNMFRIMSLNTRVLSLTEKDLVYTRIGRIPGRTNPTANMQYHGMSFPYNTSTVQYPGNDNFALEFIFDAKNEIRKKFEEASRLVFNDKSTTGNWQAPQLSDIMSVATLDLNLDPIAIYTFYGVAFKGFDAVEFQPATGNGEAVMVKANLSYYYYEAPGADTVFSGS